MLSLRSCILFCLCWATLGMNHSSSEAASRSVSRYRSPSYSSSVSARYRNYSTNRYRYSPRSSYYRNYSLPRSTYYGYGARRYNYRYRPYAAVSSYRFYRPNYYRFYGYPAANSYSYYGYNTYYPRRFCGAWNAYSSCYCSPYAGSYSVFGGSYAPLWGTYAPYWGTYSPNWGAYYGSPWSYYPGYYGSYYGLGCGLWPYRPTLYGSLIFQSGYNMGYYGRSYYRFW